MDGMFCLSWSCQILATHGVWVRRSTGAEAPTTRVPPGRFMARARLWVLTCLALYGGGLLISVMWFRWVRSWLYAHAERGPVAIPSEWSASNELKHQGEQISQHYAYKYYMWPQFHLWISMLTRHRNWCLTADSDRPALRAPRGRMCVYSQIC